MGRAPCCEKESVKRGPWTPEEDAKLLSCVAQHGTGSWRTVPKKAGLQRCGKSCRLRWTNYLRPDLKHGRFSDHEEQTIVRLHAALGSRWSLIAAQLPGRTDNDVKNYWNTRLKKKLCEMGIDPITHKPISQLLADLAGSMALQPMPAAAAATQIASGRTIAEAALGCFKDEMLNVMMRKTPTHPLQHPPSSSPNLSLASSPSAHHTATMPSSSPSSFQRSVDAGFYNSGSVLAGFEHDQLINNSKPLMHMLMDQSAPITPAAHHMAPRAGQYDFHRPDSMGAQMRSSSSSLNNSNALTHLPLIASHNLATTSMAFPPQMHHLHQDHPTTTTSTSTSTTSASTNFSTLSLSQSAEKFLQDNPIAVQPWPQLIPDQQEEEEEGEDGSEVKENLRHNNHNMNHGDQELDNVVLEHHWRGSQQSNGNKDEDDEITQLPRYNGNQIPPMTYNANNSAMSPTSFQSRMNSSIAGATSNMSWSSCPSSCTSRSSSSCSNFLPCAPSNSQDACINNYSHISSSDNDQKYTTNDSSNNPASALPNNDPSVDAMIWDLSDLNALI